MMKNYILFIVTFILAGCSAQKQTATHQISLSSELYNNTIKQAHIGFILQDLNDKKIVFQENADKNFIAASNIKLLNFLTGLDMLGDSIPSIQYVVQKDSLIIWPMADPTFLHKDFNNQKTFDFIKNSDKAIYIISGRYKGQKYGNSWAWDDFNESYQPEITDFPIYGNLMLCKQDSVQGFKLIPDLSALYFSEISSAPSATTVKRQIGNNNIIVPTQLKSGYRQYLPISFNKNVFESLLSDTLLATGMLTTPVNTLPWRAVPANAQTLYSSPSRKVYQQMLQNSDNFIAEELMLNYAAANKMEMDCQKVIAHSMLQNQIDSSQTKWVDGSGLSRLNLISPLSMIKILNEIRHKVNNDETLFSMLSEGGKSGTLKNMFINQPAFIYAKTGSMSGVYNISGFLIGKSGKKYAFSYLSNNFTVPVNEIKQDAERFLNTVYQKY